MKERLTKRDKNGNAVAFNYIKTAGEFKEIVDRLSEYEDLEEQGLIVRLPCKVGDKVYHISGKNIDKKVVTKVDYIIHNGEIDLSNSFIYVNDIYDKEDNCYRLSKLGKSVFFAYAEAEKKLKELKGEK